MSGTKRDKTVSGKNPPSSPNEFDTRFLELTALFEVSQSLTSTLSLQTILENLLRIPMGHMLISRGIILLKKNDEPEFSVSGLKGLPHQLMGKLLSIDTPPSHAVFVDEVDEKNDWISFFKEFRLKLLLPLNSSQGLIGIVGFGEKIGGKLFEESEVEFLNSLSNIAATAVTNGLMVEEIQDVNRRLDRKIQQLNTIFDISRELNTTLDEHKIASILSFAIMGELLVNKCTVFIRRDDQLDLVISKGIDPNLKIPVKVLEFADPVIVSESERFSYLSDAGISVLVPMRLQDETRGLISIGPKITSQPFDEAELEFLKTLGNQAMTSLENARLFEEALEKQRLEEELNLARTIQQGLLPKIMPDTPGYEVAAVNLPSKQVGGDYYDVISITPKRYGIAIADVSGKGAGAALLMASLQASMRALIRDDMDLDDMVGLVNNIIFQNTDLDKYITFFYGVLDIDKNTFAYCNAGHNPPFFIRADHEITELKEGGIVLGMMPDVMYQTGKVTIQPGDRILMYTDGITEAMDASGEEFGETRVKQISESFPEASARELMEHVLKAAQSFSTGDSEDDDMTLVVVRATQKPDAMS